MADNAVIHPEGNYKVQSVGPVESYDFNQNGKTVAMRKFSLQFEGIPDWINLNQVATTAEPKVGDSLEGHIEDTGKYGYKFVKKRSGGFGGGGGQASPGAIYSAAFATAAEIVAAWLPLAPQKPKELKEVFKMVEAVAVKVKESVDKLAGSEPQKPAAPAPAAPSGSTENPTDPQNEPIQLNDIKDDDLGNW
jgi:hypothetical protein